MGAESRGKRHELYANNFFAIKKKELHSKQSMYSTNYFPFGKKRILRISSRNKLKSNYDTLKISNHILIASRNDFKYWKRNGEKSEG